MLLLDKGYFDYDYEKQSVEERLEKPTWDETVKSEDEVTSLVSMFGIGAKKPDTEEEIQNYVLKHMEEQ